MNNNDFIDIPCIQKSEIKCVLFGKVISTFRKFSLTASNRCHLNKLPSFTTRFHIMSMYKKESRSSAQHPSARSSIFKSIARAHRNALKALYFRELLFAFHYVYLRVKSLQFLSLPCAAAAAS